MNRVRGNMIALTLLALSAVMQFVAILPHHHHADAICLSVTQYAVDGHAACEVQNCGVHSYGDFPLTQCSEHSITLLNLKRTNDAQDFIPLPAEFHNFITLFRVSDIDMVCQACIPRDTDSYFYRNFIEPLFTAYVSCALNCRAPSFCV